MNNQSNREELVLTLKGAARALDRILNEEFEEDFVFSIILWPDDENEDAHYYLSSADKEKVCHTLRNILLKLENNMINYDGDDNPPITNN